MAESIVSLVVERIGDLLIREAASLYGVKEEVERLQAELKRMQCFLEAADLKQDQDARVRNWVKEIREVAYDAEDVIDTFILKVERRSGTMKKLTSIFTKGSHLHEINTHIKSIQTRLADISKSLQTYGIKFSGEGEGSSSRKEMQRQLRRSYSHYTEEDVITLEESKRDLMARLMMEDERLRVVSVVGMGGLGKTTLAREVYNHFDVKQHFDCHAWVFISQQYGIIDVLSEILRKVTSPFKGDIERIKEEEFFSKKEGEEFISKKKGEELFWKKEVEEYLLKKREEELVKKLYEALRKKRYLVILDDIWETKAWDNLKPAFPNGRKGSKVLFTTRIKDVAFYADRWSPPIEPPFLTIEKGWELLYRKAFPRDVLGEHGCLPKFEKLGKEMVKKCGGLPLAIVVLGGLLATKKSLYEWEVVQRNISANLKKFEQHHYGDVYGILDLSYYYLPYHLKPCFLYFANFPEDTEIHKRRLIRLWIAEGFIPPTLEEEGEETMEDVAEQYFEELISRCMVQVGQRDHIGGVKTCRLHDLMRDLCLSHAKEENFLKIMQEKGSLTAVGTSSNMHLKTAKSRRIAFHGHMPTKLFVQRHPHIRSLLFFLLKNHTEDLTRKEEHLKLKNFKLLRVLDLDKVCISSSSLEIGKLIHLRYLVLELEGYQVFSLPESIGNLRGLLTLRLDGPSSIWLPNDLSKLECLRHLLVGRSVEGPFRIDSLKNLETLKHINAKHLIRNDALLKLTNLRNLKIAFDTTEEAEVVLKSPVFGLGRLRSLRMDILSSRPLPDLEPLSQCHHLSKLLLNGVISEDLGSNHHNLEFLPANFAKLTLYSSHFKRDPMTILEKLPNLRFLCLEMDSYVGSEMVCSAYGFPQLEILKLGSLKELEEWRVEKGAMPCLRSLSISYLPKFRMIPEGLKFVTTLQELIIHSMGSVFNNRIQDAWGVKGEDFYKVRHIPSISFPQ